MSDKSLRFKQNFSLYAIVFLCMLLFISVDFNIRYYFSQSTNSDSSAGGTNSGVVKKPGLQTVSFKAVCKYYGFLPVNSQHELGVDGSVEQIEANQWVIVPEPKLSLMLYADAGTKVMGNFKVGDCVRAIYSGDSSNRLLSVEEQK